MWGSTRLATIWWRGKFTVISSLFFNFLTLAGAQKKRGFREKEARSSAAPAVVSTEPSVVWPTNRCFSGGCFLRIHLETLLPWDIFYCSIAQIIPTSCRLLNSSLITWIPAASPTFCPNPCSQQCPWCWNYLEEPCRVCKITQVPFSSLYPHGPNLLYCFCSEVCSFWGPLALFCCLSCHKPAFR